MVQAAIDGISGTHLNRLSLSGHHRCVLLNSVDAISLWCILRRKGLFNIKQVNRGGFQLALQNNRRRMVVETSAEVLPVGADNLTIPRAEALEIRKH
jgi:hypothetical protein